MFSGIISTMGTISRSTPLGDGANIAITVDPDEMPDLKIGDSIAVNGVCLTVIELDSTSFSVDVSAETLRCTTGFSVDDKVNLERALQLSARLDGHIVIGHVDGVGVVTDFHPISESYYLEIEAPADIARYIAKKGSVSVNGVSLTTNTIEKNTFSVNLIPHTVAVTTFQTLKTGDKVNLEVDVVARYIERIMEVDAQKETK
jgi:riboflavin synthase